MTGYFEQDAAVDSRAVLSESGRRRRDTMRSELQAAMVHLHSARRRRRRVVATAVLAMTIVVSALLCTTISHSSTAPRTRPVQAQAADPAAGTPERSSSIVIVETTTGAADRYRTRGSGGQVEIIVDEAQLLRTLAHLGRPTGLIRIGGELRFTNPAIPDRTHGETGSPPNNG